MGMDMDMDMADTDMVDADGGARLSITQLAGEDGMGVQGPMAFTEIIFMFIITYMLTTLIMFTQTGVVFPVRLIIGRVGSRPELRTIIGRL
jgi:hypothetical protein